MTEVKDDFIKKVLILMFTFLFIFTIGMIVVFCFYGQTPDILITAVFAACVGEYSVCGMIKNRKEKEKTLRLAANTENEEIIPEDENKELYYEVASLRLGDIEEEPVD